MYRTLPGKPRWKRCGGEVTWESFANDFTVTWTHTFKNQSRRDRTYFAWTYPYSFQDSLDQTRYLQKQYPMKHPTVYFHRELLFYSREKRPMELLTFTGRNGITSEREETIDGLFPDKLDRPYKFDKPTIFISSRVHPGETPASFVLDGIWNILTEESE